MIVVGPGEGSAGLPSGKDSVRDVATDKDSNIDAGKHRMSQKFVTN